MSALPVLALLAVLIVLIGIKGADAVQTWSCAILLGASGLCLALNYLSGGSFGRMLRAGFAKSGRQIIPAVPILIFIGALSATWMLSGVVPTLVYYGLDLINARAFLVIACVVCAIVSVVTGTSWTTIATIGVAFMGIGTVMGYSSAWVAGAVISGAYFGDKISPLSDTTVLASSSTGVDLFTHIRFLMITTLPAMAVALGVYAVVGMMLPSVSEHNSAEMEEALMSVFRIGPEILVIPAVAAVMIALRVRTDVTLGVSSMLGLAGIFVFQPQVVESLGGNGDLMSGMAMAVRTVCGSTSIETGNELLDSLVGTSGIAGMLPTVWLVLSAMVFGGVMLGTGMLQSLTRWFTDRLCSARRLVGATVGSGLFLNACTGDQYLSLIIGGNMFKSAYRREGLKPQVLSRSLEDSVSVTSVLIPWNSCGLTQSTVLGVATLTYLPCCVFNIMSPLMSLFIAWIGWRVRVARHVAPAVG